MAANKKRSENEAVVQENTKKSKAKEKKKAEAKGAKASEKQKSPKKTAKTEPKNKKAENKPKKRSKFRYLSGLLMAKMAIGGAAELSHNADEVNKLNVFPVPDGDTGDNMRMTIESGIKAIENLDTDDLGEVMNVFSHGMLLGARGNSGVILSQLFAGIAKGLAGSNKADPATLGHALELGVAQAYASVMTPTEGTILTVAREAVEYAVRRITPESTIRTFFADLVKEMHKSLDRTPDILPMLKEAEVVDSGGAGLLYIIDGFNRVLNGQKIEAAEPLEKKEKSSEKEEKSAPVSLSAFGPDSVMTYGYCTELLVRVQNSKCDAENFDIEPLKAFLSGIGDSIVAFKTETIVKIHVHTLTPEKVLEYCRTFGEFLAVKIENMSLQHTSREEDTESSVSEAPVETETVSEAEPVNTERKRYGVVAVASGDGLESIFREFGADVVIRGGQTQNPSTNDFLDAFEKINAEHIFVLPNNGNIMMAAAQASEMYEKAEIHVVGAKNTGLGYAAISTADFSEEDPEKLLAMMEESMNRVLTGYISPSIRDADIGGVHISNGDTMGIIDKEIVVSSADPIEALKALAARLLDGRYVLTAFVGRDATEEEQNALADYVKESFPDAELYLTEGAQEVYPFIFVAE